MLPLNIIHKCNCLHTLNEMRDICLKSESMNRDDVQTRRKEWAMLEGIYSCNYQILFLIRLFY